MMNEPTIHIVDDDVAVLLMLKILVGSVYSHVRAYGSAGEFIDSYKPEIGGGCLLLDVRMPFMNGLELQEELLKRAIDLPIIFLTGHGDIRLAVQAIKKGAYDFIEKPYDNRHLLDRIQAALVPARNGQDTDDQPDERDAQLRTLTAREREVLEMIIEGATNKGVARELGISDKTVEIYRANVMRKMKAKSFAGLVKMMTQSHGRI